VVGAGSGPIGPEGLPLGEALTRPNVARVYDSWLGGRDNLAVDREVAARVAQAAPVVVAGVRANRAFVRRAVTFLAESGIDQFVDLGSGLPTAENVHEVAGRINPAAKVAYVDFDPIVLVHARALLADPSRTIVIEGDVRDPQGILANPELRDFIDLRRPVAVVAAAILHFVSDVEDPARIVATFRDVMPPGSYLVITHVVDDGDAGVREGAAIYSDSTAPFVPRCRTQVEAWFDGFRPVPPGLVDADGWRRAGNGKVTAPVVAGVGFLDGPEIDTGAMGSGAGLARRREGEWRDG
jgi:SAM-dependent methyltransferase